MTLPSTSKAFFSLNRYMHGSVATLRNFGDLYAAASTRPSNTVGVTSILGGSSDNTGSGIARRLVLKPGLNIILACSIPKNSPMLE
ncbi:hypothetical protein SLA2020_092370, partial [Shorea laevis]